MDLASARSELLAHGAIQLVAGWSNEEFFKLLEMYSNKCTLAAMATHFGRTKGQISGLLFRARQNGLIQQVHRSIIVKVSPPAEVAPKVDPASINELKLVQRLRQKAKKRRVRLRLIEDQNQVTFAELEPHHCRWPIGDPRLPDFRFCGCNRVEGRPYCEAHNHAASRQRELDSTSRQQLRPFYR